MTTFVESVAPLLTVLTPLVAVPLTVITFYLRSLREQQVSWHRDLVHRMDSVETATGDLRKAIDEFERDYTTKEEWLRECMLARRTLDQLSESIARLGTARRLVDWLPRASPEDHPIDDGATNTTRNRATDAAASTVRPGEHGKDGQ